MQDEDGDWRRAGTTLPASLATFPARVDTTRFGWGEPVELPTGGDGAFSGDGLEAGSGYEWRQLARRKEPLTPRLAARMLWGRVTLATVFVSNARSFPTPWSSCTT